MVAAAIGVVAAVNPEKREKRKKEKRGKKKTYNTKDSLVVTDPTTSLVLWAYVSKAVFWRDI